MSASQVRVGIFVGMFLLLSPFAGRPQGAEKDLPAKPPSEKSSVPKAEKKPALSEIMRVSTSQVARTAAQEKGKGRPAQESGDQPSDSGSLELRPLAQGAEVSSEAVAIPSRGSRKSPLKNVHGTVYGSVDPKNKGTHRAGASVGATSKSGKSGIYVETERSREIIPPSR